MIAVHLLGGQLEETLGRARFAVLPLSSVEYHGPAAPLGTDYFLAQYFADYLAPRPDAVVYPMVAYTACPAKTAKEPSTVSVDGPVMLAYLTQVLSAIATGGPRRVVLLNAHDGNMGIARAAAEAVTVSGFSALIVNWWQLVEDDFTKTLFSDGGRGHGGPYELSAACAAAGLPLAVPPELDRAAYRLETARPAVVVEESPRNFKGYAGLVSQAGLEKGEAVLRRAAENLDGLIEQWLAHLEQKDDKSWK